MPGLIRKLFICAGVNGLVIQAHGPVDHHRTIQIDYKTRQIKDGSANDGSKHSNEVQLEAHGLIGLLSIASSSFLIAITRREQVAQIFGKPIYVITDVAFLPLTSRQEAAQAITDATEARRSREPSSDSELSDSDADETVPSADLDRTGSSPTDELPAQPRSDTSIAQDVFVKRGQFGRFASQWFSKQGWGIGEGTGRPQTVSGPASEEAKLVDDTATPPFPAGGQQGTAPETADDSGSASKGGQESSPVIPMIPKIFRATRLILASRSFFFSYELDVTRSMASLSGVCQPPTKRTLDPLYFWNRNLGMPFYDAGKDSFLTPIMQGFVGQRPFVVKKPSKHDDRSSSVVAVDHPVDDSSSLSHAIAQVQEELTKADDDSQAYLLTLISRRSVKRSGLRYLRRGIDDDGNCANAVETEQVLSSPEWAPSSPIRSFTQVRASIPVYFSQSPYAFKPVPAMHHPQEINDKAMEVHFRDLRNRYGDVQAALLVDKHGNEVSIGEAYEKAVQRLAESNRVQGVALEWFDFHAECRGMKFENVERLVQKLKDKIEAFGVTIIVDGAVKHRQSGIVRTNCMDCLDRTNVAESAFGQHMLQTALEQEGFAIDLVHDEGTTWFNTLWADNGDACSRQYAGTAALKGDFTRTRKRDYRGALNDFSLTLTRYYNNMVNDYLSQAVIDVLLGNLSWKALEDFETRMMSADPGVSVEKVRESAIETCWRQVIQDETEDMIHGWTMLVPAHANTLRSLPFSEAVVLLTDAAIYCCKFDWTTEKVASFEKIDLRTVSKIRYGTYVTSTLSEVQQDERLNAGLVVIYRPGKDNVVRTNTRSLQNYVEVSESGQENRIDGGTGVLSWLAPRAPITSQVLALKVIAQTSDRGSIISTKSNTPLGIAQNISEEIVRAMGGARNEASSGAKDLVEEGDIISLLEAKKRTGYLEQLGHSIKKLVWS